MTVVVNGKNHIVEDSGVLLDVIGTLTLNPRNTVCMVNGDIIPLEQYANTVLHDGDTLDVLAFVGGG